jgi:hypothetical protein
MTEGVNDQAIAQPEKEAVQTESLSDKERNFRRLEAARDQEREARIRAQMEAEELKKRLDHIEQMMQPKEIDPLDEVQDITDLDSNRFKAILSDREAKLERKAKQIAKTAIQEHEQEKKKTNFREELRRQHQDYDTVMNEQTIAYFSEREPEAVAAITAIEDPYVRCEQAYHFFKKKMPAKEEKPSIKEKVEENSQNPYYIPSGSGTPPYSAVEFDVRSPSAQKAAYAKLKEAQRRPIGNGQGAHIRQ